MNFHWEFNYDGEVCITLHWLFLLVLAVLSALGDISLFSGLLLATFGVTFDRITPETPYAIG